MCYNNCAKQNLIFKYSKEIRYFLGGFVPFSVSTFKFGKNANFAWWDTGFFSLYLLSFVWRQLEFAFFGALISVGAPFYFSPKNLFIGEKNGNFTKIKKL